MTAVPGQPRDLCAELQASIDRARATRLTPEQLRHQADVLESQQCTGVSATWCPVHGTCLCQDREDQNDSGCPLHSSASSHAAAALAEIFGDPS